MGSAAEKIVQLRPLNIQRMKLKIIGTSPYMPEPVDMSVAEYYNKKKSLQSVDKDTRSEEEKAKEKFYYTEDGKYGMPVRALYRSGEKGSKYVLSRSDGGMKKFAEAVNVLGDIVELHYERLEIDKRTGRPQGQSKSPRLIIRNKFINWWVEIEVEFNASAISAEQVVNIFECAGFHIGVGGFRKECKGNFGLFKVAKD